MKVEKGFLGGFLVLGFVIFIAGFLLGMLAFAMIQVEPDLTSLGLMWFLLGFVLGALAIGAAMIIWRWNKMSKKPQQSP